MDELSQPIDHELLCDLVDFALERGVDRIHLRAGCLPLLSWHGATRQVRCRPLTDEDTEAIVSTLLDWAYVPSSAASQRCEAARLLSFVCEPPVDGLLQVAVARDAGALALSIDVIRPMESGDESGELGP